MTDEATKEEQTQSESVESLVNQVFNEIKNPENNPKVEEIEKVEASPVQQDAETVKTEPENKIDDKEKKIEPSEIEKQIASLNEKVALSEKRVKDNQRAFQDEHQNRLKLEKEIEELKKKQSSRENEDGGDGFFDDEDNKEKNKTSDQKIQEIESKLKAIEEDNARLRHEQAVAAFNNAAEPLRKTNSDFDEVVDFLGEIVEKDASVANLWKESEKTPKAAYELGKKIKERMDFLNDPEAAMERMRERIKKELEAVVSNNAPDKNKKVDDIIVEEPKKTADLSKLNPNSVSSTSSAQQSYPGSLLGDICPKR